MTSNEHDFDFVLGQWRVHNRKLADVTDPGCERWVEFDATSEAYPILGGLGHVDRLYVDEPADGGPPFEGFTLRMFEPGTATWRIWWSSSRVPGVLDTPVAGRFVGAHGIFEAGDTINGRPVAVRFEWLAQEPRAPRWQQSFSFDAGQTWSVNWIMDLSPTT